MRASTGRGGEAAGAPPDLASRVGTVALANPVMTASGTSGHGAELSAYGDLADLGAVVVKSLAAFPWEGNLPLRVAPVATGMVNSVGLTGPGVAAWIGEHLPSLNRSGARVVVSLWGRTAGEYGEAARQLEEALGQDSEDPSGIVAVEVNVSCPNTEDRGRMFAQSAGATAEAVAAVRNSTSLPIWAKLTAAVADLNEIAGAALEGGAAALTLVNTLPAMAVDIDLRRPVLGGVTGGLSGPALHPVAVRCVFECRSAFPEAGIIGVGGVLCAADAIELLMAGADAVQVGTATFVDPRAPWKIVEGIRQWCHQHSVSRLDEIKGAAHR